MTFLRRLLLHCANWLLTKWSKGSAGAEPQTVFVPYVLSADERVSRFIYTHRNIRRTAHRPKPGAFDPSPYMELSVAHTSNLSDAQVWRIGGQTLGSQPGRSTIYARADIPVLCLSDVKLRALRDDRRFRRHTSVIDWPLGSDTNETKALWKEICLELSEDLRVNLAVSPGPVVRV
jgi:hypothetical protein